MKKFLKLLLGASLFVLEQSDRATRSARERASDQIDDLRDSAQKKYQVAADRVAKASQALRGDENQGVRNALRFAAGVGIGIGMGLMIAPASGGETRTVIAEKAQEFGSKVRKQFSSEDLVATGTGD